MPRRPLVRLFFALFAALAASACAAAAPVVLRVPGGELEVRWKPGERATLIGDAVREFERIV